MKLLKSALALAMGFTSAASLASDTITIEDIPKIQSVSSTSVSPDGELVAFTRSVPRELYVDQNGSNYSELYVVDDEGVERPFITGKVSHIKHLLVGRRSVHLFPNQEKRRQATRFFIASR